MEYKVISSRSPSELTRQVNEHIKDGWKPVGGHTVVTVNQQNRYSGLQHMSTVHETEYSQTIIKDGKEHDSN